MPRSNRRATAATVDSVHRLVGKELGRQLKLAGRAKEPASAALLSAAIAYLKLTGTTDPARLTPADRLKAALPTLDELDAATKPPHRGTP